MTATLENRKENAYNTSLSLSFSRNLHLASFTPQVSWGEGLREESEKEGAEWALSSAARGSGERPSV